MGLELRPSYAICRFTKSGDREQGTRNKEQGTGSTRKGASGGQQWSPLFVVREELRRNPCPCRHFPAGAASAASFSGRHAAVTRPRAPRSAPSLARDAGVIYSRSDAHTSELPSLLRISSAVFCLK